MTTIVAAYVVMKGWPSDAASAPCWFCQDEVTRAEAVVSGGIRISESEREDGSSCLRLDAICPRCHRDGATWQDVEL